MHDIYCMDLIMSICHHTIVILLNVIISSEPYLFLVQTKRDLNKSILMIVKGLSSDL